MNERGFVLVHHPGNEQVVFTGDNKKEANEKVEEVDEGENVGSGLGVYRDFVAGVDWVSLG